MSLLLSDGCTGLPKMRRVHLDLAPGALHTGLGLSRLASRVVRNISLWERLGVRDLPGCTILAVACRLRMGQRDVESGNIVGDSGIGEQCTLRSSQFNSLGTTGLEDHLVILNYHSNSPLSGLGKCRSFLIIPLSIGVRSLGTTSADSSS